MAYSQEQIDALRAAIATGVRRVNYNGRDVQYATTDEMLKVLAIMEGEVAQDAGIPLTKRSFARFSKGYTCSRERW